MRAHYDFSKMKARKNPYVKLLKQPVTLRLDRDTVAYFKDLAAKTGLPYQQLINLVSAGLRGQPSGIGDAVDAVTEGLGDWDWGSEAAYPTTHSPDPWNV